MKYQKLFSGKNKKNTSICHLLGINVLNQYFVHVNLPLRDAVEYTLLW